MICICIYIGISLSLYIYIYMLITVAEAPCRKPFISAVEVSSTAETCSAGQTHTFLRYAVESEHDI